MRGAVDKALGIVTVCVGLVGSIFRLQLFVQEVVDEVKGGGTFADVVSRPRHADEVDLEREGGNVRKTSASTLKNYEIIVRLW